jgi:hypothetical protein
MIAMRKDIRECPNRQHPVKCQTGNRINIPGAMSVNRLSMREVPKEIGKAVGKWIGVRIGGLAVEGGEPMSSVLAVDFSVLAWRGGFETAAPRTGLSVWT